MNERFKNENIKKKIDTALIKIAASNIEMIKLMLKEIVLLKKYGESINHSINYSINHFTN